MFYTLPLSRRIFNYFLPTLTLWEMRGFNVLGDKHGRSECKYIARQGRRVLRIVVIFIVGICVMAFAQVSKR